MIFSSTCCSVILSLPCCNVILLSTSYDMILLPIYYNMRLCHLCTTVVFFFHLVASFTNVIEGFK